MSIILDIEFSGSAERETIRRRGSIQFSQYIKRGPKENYLKFGLGKSSKSILDSRMGNYT